MAKRILLLFVLILPLFVSAQRNKRYKWEACFGIGAANFLGDLGGANQIGTNGFRDLEFSLTKPAVSIGARYRKGRYWGYKAAFSWGTVSGFDYLTTEKYRHNRNIHFKSNIFEFAAVTEFYFTKERPGHIYKYKKLKGWRHIDVQTYLFAGIGGFWYNPKGSYHGTWLALQPLGTEGQGVKPGTKKYNRLSVCVPIGLGFKYALDRRWSIGLEMGLRKTFTDYIDDVSTVYYDPAEIALNNGNLGAAASFFANPSQGEITAAENDGVDPTGIGQQRGDATDNDSYMFVHVTVNYKLGKFRKTKSKF
ncbi:MAG TPA: DUF6089 family protein [Bacteroidia bacterium]|nr:DUF6089 family protein [Bacteroidia bacterium]